MNLTNKKILLAITGGIAAYKTPILVRRLRDQGAEVKVILSKGGANFVTALSLQAVSGNEVRSDLLDSEAESGMDHIDMARWADMMIIAPATAHTIAKLVHGLADDLLTTLALATSAPIVLAPAMNQQMWQNPITQKNIALAESQDFLLCGPANGEQACGEVGFGRMSEPEDIVAFASQYFTNKSSKRAQDRNINIVITAGPTFEAIDPVRGITNHSSGQMGYSLAKAAAIEGCTVTLISGPTALKSPDNVSRIDIKSAQEMHDSVHQHIMNADIFISVAAIADYRPAVYADSKIKKDQTQSDTMTLSLVKNPDILASVGHLTENRPFCVGFAAETDDVIENAKRKIISKNIDMIIANKVGNNIGFGNKEHQVTILNKDNDNQIELGPKSKESLAHDIIEAILTAYPSE